MKTSATSWEAAYRRLLEASSFAARAHHGQMRKDKETPYISHVFRVCLIVRDTFGISDHAVLMAALLHDTVEDTTKDFDDVAELFGEEVARWVATLSKDKRRPEPEREKMYESELTSAPWQVQVCKLADVFDNLLDSCNMPAAKRAKSLRNARRYLDALKTNLQEPARPAWKIVSELFQELEAQKAKESLGS